VEFNRASKIFIFSEKFSGQSDSMWRMLKYLFVEITPFIAVIESFDDAQVVLETVLKMVR
jgi:hypothetical protein